MCSFQNVFPAFLLPLTLRHVWTLGTQLMFPLYTEWAFCRECGAFLSLARLGRRHYDVKSQSFNPGLQYPHLHGPVHTPDNNRWDTPPV